MQDKIAAVIVAGGEGKRMGGGLPKQFQEISGKPVIVHTLEKFKNNANVTEIVVVCRKDCVEMLKGMIETWAIGKVNAIVEGGSTRQESSYNGVKNCGPDADYVLIHDAVRPFVSDRVINDVISALKTTGAAAPAVDVTDTVVISKNGLISDVPDRETLKRIQTPQGFAYGIIKEAHEKTRADKRYGFSDDCGMVVYSGKPVKLVEGDVRNIKITTPEDLDLSGKIT